MSSTGKYYECSVVWEHINDETGKFEKINDTYLVSGVTFGDAENNVLTVVADKYREAPEVASARVVQWTEVVEPDSEASQWYAIKCFWEEENDKGKLKKINESYLVPAGNTQECLKKILKHLDLQTVEYEITSVAKTKIVGVYLS